MTKILTIDDEEVLTEAYKLTLTKAGHTVFSANRGAAGLETAKKEKPDLIFLDMLMPEMDGLDFLKHFKDLKLSKTKIVILSNIDNEEVVSAAKRLGALDYLSKANVTPYEIADAAAKYE